MNILHVIDCINLRQGGPSRSVTALAEAQAKLGHEVVIACRDYAYLGVKAEASGVRVETIPGGRWTKGHGGWGWAFRKLVELEAKKADVVHNHGMWLAANYYARRAAGKAGKPLVISTRGMVETWSVERSRQRKSIAWVLFEKENLRRAALFHATSAEEATAIGEVLRRWKMGDGRWGAWKSPSTIADLRSSQSFRPRIVIAPNGVSVPAQIPGREVLEKKCDQLRGRKWMVFMSRLHPKKGLWELAQVWREMGGKYPEWKLVMVGPEQDRAYVKKVRGVIGEEAVWMGELGGDEKWCALGNAEAFVLPTYSENFGMVVAESLAVGVPVLTTTGTPWGGAEGASGVEEVSGGKKETMNVEVRECGIICEPGVDGVREGLGRMLEKTDEERRQMGRMGKAWMEREFSWESCAKKLIEAYGWGVGKGIKGLRGG